MIRLRPSLVLIFALIYCGANAQKIGANYLPSDSLNSPAWFKIFYQKDFETKVNVFKLDDTFREYVKELHEEYKENTNAKEPEGEENEDRYSLYYIRWRRAIEPFIQSDGSLHIPKQKTIPSDDQIINSPFHQDLTNTPNGSSSPWSSLGPKSTYWLFSDNSAQPQCPWQVNIYSCTMAPSNHNVLYAGPETGGLFKTTDKGLNWALVLDIPSTVPFTAVAVHPTDPNIVYAGNNGIIYMSTNGGTSWTSQSPACGEVHAISIRPGTPTTIFAACQNGLFTSTNSGASWSVVSGMTTACYDVLFKTDNDNIVFALKVVSGFTQFWRSTDAGVTFAASITGWTGKGVSADEGGRMTVTPANSSVIYAALLGASPSITKPYIFKSTDAGLTWDTVSTGISSGLTGNSSTPLGMSNGQGFYDFDIMANPANAAQLLVATTSLYKSTNSGASFTLIGGYGGTFSTHPDVQEIISLGSDTWIATDGGMNYSTDFFTSTTNHSARNNGIYGSDYWGLAQGWNEDLVAGGRYHNGNDVQYENYTSGNSLRLGGGEAATGYYLMGRTRGVAFSDIGGRSIPATFNGTAANFNFNKYPNEDYYFNYSSDVQCLPYCYTTLYQGQGNDFWMSTDNGLTWTSLHTFSGRVAKYKISRSNPNVIYLATEYGFYKSTDGGNNWTTITLPTGVSLTIMQVEMSFTDENVLWITGPYNSSGNRIHKSTDGGASWTNLTTATINGQSYYNLLAQAGTNDGVYIIGRAGKVFYRNNSMSDWASFAISLPLGFNPTKTLAFYRDGKIRTSGNHGIWEVAFYEDGVPIAQPSVDKLSSNCPRDTFYFDDYSAFKQSGGTWSWSFSPAPLYVSSTTVRNPKVVFGATGTYSFSLTITNSAGSSSKTVSNKIQVLANYCTPDTVAGKMLTFTNPGDYAEQSRGLNITTNTLTISCWIKPNGTQPSFAGIVFSPCSGASGMCFRNSNELGYTWADGPATYNWSSGLTVPANVWSHVALVITATSTSVYLNGVVATQTIANAAVNFNAPFQIGIDRNNTGRNFKGLMDELCIYNRAMTTNEIRELMNLTRNNPGSGSLPSTDANLIAYYQFNEGSGDPGYDKVGMNHAIMAGGINKTAASTAPVGGGTFARLTVNSSGAKTFTAPNVVLTFPAASTYPNGDLVVTKIRQAPDQNCTSNTLPVPSSYYIIRNYGTNATFTALTSIRFNAISGTSAGLAAYPSQLGLFKRTSSADGATWGSLIDSADIVTNVSGLGNVTFSTGLSLTSFSQFQIGKMSILLPIKLTLFTAELQTDETVKLHWEAAAEDNLNSYDIEYSMDGASFERLGNIKSGKKIYDYIHDKPHFGLNYYRLKMIDNNGDVKYSAIRKIDFENGTRPYVISPNPSEDGVITITSANSDMRIVNLSLMNELGQVISILNVPNQGTNPVYKFYFPLPQGKYFIEITAADGYRKIEQLIIK